MKVSEFLTKELNVSLDSLKHKVSLGPAEHRLCLDGLVLSLDQEMPEYNPGDLFRVGKHLFAIKEAGLMKLTQGEF